MHGFQLWANLPSSLKMTAPRYQDVKGARNSRSRRRRRHARARRVRRLLGQEGPGRRRRRRSALSRRVRAGRQAQDAQGRDRAPRLRLCVRGRRHVRVPRRSRSACSARSRSTATRSWCANRSATARSCCSIPATRSPCRPATRHPLPAGVRQADRGAGRLVRADRHEHAGRAAAGRLRTAQRDVHQGLGLLRNAPICGAPLARCTASRHASHVSRAQRA